MESIFARCPVCLKTKQVRGDFTDKKAKCPCGEVFVVSGESLTQVKTALWQALTKGMQNGDNGSAQELILQLQSLHPSEQEQLDLSDLLARCRQTTMIKSERQLAEIPPPAPRNLKPVWIGAVVMLIAVAAFAGSYLASHPSQPVTVADTEPVQPQPAPVEPAPVEPLDKLKPQLDAIFTIIDSQPEAAALQKIMQPETAVIAANWITDYWRKPSSRSYSRYRKDEQRGLIYIEVMEDGHPRIYCFYEPPPGPLQLAWSATEAQLAQAFAAEDISQITGSARLAVTLPTPVKYAASRLPGTQVRLHLVTNSTQLNIEATLTTPKPNTKDYWSRQGMTDLANSLHQRIALTYGTMFKGFKSISVPDMFAGKYHERIRTLISHPVFAPHHDRMNYHFSYRPDPFVLRRVLQEATVYTKRTAPTHYQKVIVSTDPTFNANKMPQIYSRPDNIKKGNNVVIRALTDADIVMSVEIPAPVCYSGANPYLELLLDGMGSLPEGMADGPDNRA
jgi:hypothetical protein